MYALIIVIAMTASSSSTYGGVSIAVNSQQITGFTNEQQCEAEGARTVKKFMNFSVRRGEGTSVTYHCTKVK